MYLREIRHKDSNRLIKKMKILIVDDSVFHRAVLEKILKEEGYLNITSYTCATEVFEFLKVDKADEEIQNIDLILMDNIMPDISGIEACKKLKTSEKYHDIPIIMITAKDDDVELAFNAGALDYVTRPFKKEELLARIYLTLSLKDLLNKQKEREQKLLNEINLAKVIQHSVLTSPIKNDKIDVDAYYIPSEGLSGDMYYCNKINEDKYGIFIMDVAGHGISSSLISMSLRSLMDGMINRGLDPRDVIHEMNKHVFNLYKKTKGLTYLTALYMIIDTQDQSIEYVNAGHPPALVLSSEDQITQLNRTTIPVGMRNDIEIQKEKIYYSLPTQIVLYTDGLVEVPKRSIKAGIQELEDTIIENKHLGNKRFFSHLLTKRSQMAEITDDLCLIRIRLEQ